MIDMGARRARSEEIKTGKILTGRKPDYMSAQSKDLQKRLTALDEKQMQDKLIKKADSKMGPARGPRKKVNKPFVKTSSEIKLEKAQERNAKINRSNAGRKKLTEKQKDLRLARMQKQNTASKTKKPVQRYGNPPEKK